MVFKKCFSDAVLHCFGSIFWRVVKITVFSSHAIVRITMNIWTIADYTVKKKYSFTGIVLVIGTLPILFFQRKHSRKFQKWLLFTESNDSDLFCEFCVYKQRILCTLYSVVSHLQALQSYISIVWNNVTWIKYTGLNNSHKN